MSIQIQNPSEVATASYSRWGIFGDNGVGKTSFLASIPPELHVWVISADQENVKPLIPYENHIKVTKLNRWDDLLEVHRFLAKGLLLADGTPDPAVRSGEKPFFNVIAFDTWTRLQALAANKIVGYEMLKPSDVEKYVTTAPKTPQGYQAWQQVGALVAEWLGYFNTLPIHTVSLFQEGFRQSDQEGEDGKIGPLLTPLALRRVMDGLELVGRLYIDYETKPEEGIVFGAEASHWKINAEQTEKRRLLVGKHPGYRTKGPTHILGYTVEDPTWAKLAKSLSSVG